MAENLNLATAQGITSREEKKKIERKKKKKAQLHSHYGYQSMWLNEKPAEIKQEWNEFRDSMTAGKRCVSVSMYVFARQSARAGLDLKDLNF